MHNLYIPDHGAVSRPMNTKILSSSSAETQWKCAYCLCDVSLSGCRSMRQVKGLEREGSVLRYVSLLRASSSVGLVFDAWTIRSGIDAGILELVLLGLQDSWQNGKSGA